MGETDTEMEDMVTAVVTGTAVAMAVVAAAAVEDVATERSPGMVVNGHFKQEQYMIYLFERVLRNNKYCSVPFSTRKSCVPVLCVYEVHSFSSRSCTTTLQR